MSARLASGRLPFRRVDEAPSVLTANGQGRPDLVLWINRDSLIAGAIILLTGQDESEGVAEGWSFASALGLGQFVTWGEKRITLWESSTAPPRPRTRWTVIDADGRPGFRYAAPLELLIQELKAQAVNAPLPPGQLPPAYFANLCRQALRDIEPALEEAARLANRPGLPGAPQATARDKGWLTLWRLLALLRENRLPSAVRPELIERAILYPLAELPPPLAARLTPPRGEFALPESAAIRFHHLAVRLTQLNWRERSEHVRETLLQLARLAAQDCQVETTPLSTVPGVTTLLVNHLPPATGQVAGVVAPAPCLAALALTQSCRATLPAAQTADLPADLRPSRIIAALHNQQPPAPAGRRRYQSALRISWPYRRFHIPAAAPEWLWEALHLGGLLPASGHFEVSLPANWVDSPAAPLLWQALGERLSLVRLELLHGRHHLTWKAPRDSGNRLEFIGPTGGEESHRLPAGAPLADLLALLPCRRELPTPGGLGRKRSLHLDDDQLAGRVFRDGVPCFPDHYLRRLDCPSLCSYQLDGPLQPDETFFNRVTLRGPDGTLIETANPVTAEALLLVSRSAPRRIELPIDPLVTARLLAAYRNDLVTLWDELCTECRRHASSHSAALTRARRIWRNQALPPLEELQADTPAWHFPTGRYKMEKL